MGVRTGLGEFRGLELVFFLRTTHWRFIFFLGIGIRALRAFFLFVVSMVETAGFSACVRHVWFRVIGVAFHSLYQNRPAAAGREDDEQAGGGWATSYARAGCLDKKGNLQGRPRPSSTIREWKHPRWLLPNRSPHE